MVEEDHRLRRCMRHSNLCSKADKYHSCNMSGGFLLLFEQMNKMEILENIYHQGCVGLLLIFNCNLTGDLVRLC